MEIIREAVATAAEKYPDDIEAAVDAAEKKLRSQRSQSGFREVVDFCVRLALRRQIHDFRTIANQRMKNHCTQDSRPKVDVAGCPVVNRIALDRFNYFIGAKQLGGMTRDELLVVADAEHASANGHLFNRDLCKTLSKVVTGSKTVKECVTNTRLDKMFEGIQEKQT